MKILHAVHGYPPEFHGGSELYVEKLVEAQQTEGHEVLVLAGTNERGPEDCNLSEREGTRVYRLHRRGLFHERWDHGRSLRAESILGDLCAAEQPDLVHLHHWIRLSRGLVRACRATGLPCVVTLHDLYATCPRIFRIRDDDAFCERELSIESCLDCAAREPWMRDDQISLGIEAFAGDMRAELEAASLRLVPSAAHAKVLARFTGLPTRDFVVLPHGSTTRVAASRNRSPGAASGRLGLAHWGHLIPAKGAHVLLEALHMLEHPERVALELWGRADDAAYAARLDELCAGLQVARREEFTPADLDALAADVAVFPSLAHESYSFVLDEASALGMPSLVSDRGALPERCGSAALVFGPGDPAALAKRLAALLDDEGLLTRLRAQLPEPLSIAEHTGRLLERYKKVARGRRRKSGTLPDDEALAREGLLRVTEERARELEGLREKASSEAALLTRDLAELEVSVAQYESEAVDTRADLANHATRLAESEVDLAAHKARLAEVLADLEGHQARIADLRSDLEGHRALVTDLRADLAGHHARVADLDADLVRHRTRLAELETELGAQREVLDAARTERDASARALEAARADLEAMLAELESRAERIVELERENRLALPLVLPARLLLRVWDRLHKRKKP